MDRITTALLEDFSGEHGLQSLEESKRFEHFAGFITLRRHFSGTFDTADIVTGGGDTGIDSISILVNGNLINDLDGFIDIERATDTLDVIFVFSQAERSASFEAAKIGTFHFGVQDFFKESPTLPRGDDVARAASIMSAIYSKSTKFRRGNPSCFLYYVTTGKWLGDTTLESRRRAATDDLVATGQFKEVDFIPVGADNIQRFYNLTKNAIAREFTFANRVDVPEIPGVTEAYLGYIPASQFLALIRDDGGEIIRTIFYDNVRDWQDYNDVNRGIRDTLLSDKKVRFVLMNNGITIIARGLRKTGSKFNIEDYQIVNGCQTSHVLFDQQSAVDDSIQVPIKLIATQDENIIDAIIRGTNKQTEVRPEQFAAITEFAKKLEQFFQTFPAENRLYYERRPAQYERMSMEKTRIITQPNMVRAFAGMLLGEPHRTSRSYRSLTDRLGTEIYGADHKLEPYYAAAFSLYRLEYLFRTNRLATEFKVARFQLLHLIRLMIDGTSWPRSNSKDADTRARAIVDNLQNVENAANLFWQACEVIINAGGGLDRDKIHTQQYTDTLTEMVKKSAV